MDTVVDSEEPGIAWPDLTRGQRAAYMGSVFLPEITAVMEAHDPAYGRITCSTCHGSDFEEVDYAMPNGMAPLDPAAFPSPDDGGVAAMMFEGVTPKAVELLGAEPFDPATGEGFGCYGCHDMP